MHGLLTRRPSPEDLGPGTPQEEANKDANKEPAGTVLIHELPPLHWADRALVMICLRE